ncbi:hypothetical protein RIF29_28805 [Crotalaria pallida]|uniref:Uncharacterized protein n=1 Tax=Crotalaria pallida TaxID=3830 RepID=A0AAN9EDL8_CROPI
MFICILMGWHGFDFQLEQKQISMSYLIGGLMQYQMLVEELITTIISSMILILQEFSSTFEHFDMPLQMVNGWKMMDSYHFFCPL